MKNWSIILLTAAVLAVVWLLLQNQQLSAELTQLEVERDSIQAKYKEIEAERDFEKQLIAAYEDKDRKSAKTIDSLRNRKPQTKIVYRRIDERVANMDSTDREEFIAERWDIPDGVDVAAARADSTIRDLIRYDTLQKIEKIQGMEIHLLETRLNTKDGIIGAQKNIIETYIVQVSYKDQEIENLETQVKVLKKKNRNGKIFGGGVGVLLLGAIIFL